MGGPTATFAPARITLLIVRLLVLGGTAWLGRCIVSTAVERGHEVTCLARGASGDPPEGAVFVQADRSHASAYEEVATQNWDSVIDVGRQPGQLRSAVEALADRTSIYAFVSSCSVYADHSTPGRDVAQVIDVRDLAAWIVDAVHRRIAGTFNATGESVPFLEHLETARAVAGHTGPVIRVDQRPLVSQGVQEWMGPRSLPLWLADPAWIGFNARDSRRARRTGMVTRPLQETLADTLAWEKTRDPARTRGAGLSDDRERSLLEALAGAVTIPRRGRLA